MLAIVETIKLRVVALFAGALLLVVVDQVSKGMARTWFAEHVVCNHGIALSMPVGMALTVIMSVVIISALGWWTLIFARGWWQRVAGVLIIAGGIGNLIDRLVAGCVTDFLPFFGLWTFNVADAAISVGAVLLIVLMVKSDYDAAHKSGSRSQKRIRTAKWE